MSELDLPKCPICFAENSLSREMMERAGQPFTWYECRECGSVLLSVGDDRWAYQKVGREGQAHLLKQPMTVAELQALVEVPEQPSVAPAPVVHPIPTEAQDASPEPTPPTPEKEKRGPSRWVILAVVVVGLCFVCAVMGILVGMPSGDQPTATPIEVAAVEAASPEPQPSDTQLPTEAPTAEPEPTPWVLYVCGYDRCKDSGEYGTLIFETGINVWNNPDPDRGGVHHQLAHHDQVVILQTQRVSDGPGGLWFELEGGGWINDLWLTQELCTEENLSQYALDGCWGGPTVTPPPPDTPSTDTPEPVLGMSRSSPYARAEVAVAPGWEIQVLETVRGDAAWQAILAANQFNDPAPEGMEYLLVKLHVKSTHDDGDEHMISESDFAVTGDRLVEYPLPSVVSPDPQLEATLFSGGETEGWGTYMVAQGEGSLLLVIDELLSFEEDRIRYVALDAGASLDVPAELESIEPTDLGRDRESPASFGETVITEDWEVTILDTLRGQDAWIVILDANQFNDPPEEGMEYILVKARARNIGTAEESVPIDGFFFRTMGMGNVLYDVPSVVDPSPTFECYLFPGGVCEGWAALQAGVDEDGMMVMFEPVWDFGEENRRWLSLER